MLYQMQKTLSLYLHTSPKVFESSEGTITLFHLSTQKLNVPLISIVQWISMDKDNCTSIEEKVTKSIKSGFIFICKLGYGGKHI